MAGEAIALANEDGTDHTAELVIGSQGEHELACLATDGALPPAPARSTDRRTRSFQIDSVPPSLAPIVSGTGASGMVATLRNGQRQSNASDPTPGSGVDPTATVCSTLETSSPGTHTVTCTARDTARNVSSQTASYVVSTALAHLTARFTAPPPSSQVRARSTVTIGVKLLGANGARIKDVDGKAIASACQLTVSAKRVQTLAPSCMTYDPSRDEFRYPWKLGRETGGATLTATMSYPGTTDTTVISESIAIVK
ncbi:MAG: hypothetical protein U0610_12410 [bacterium]